MDTINEASAQVWRTRLRACMDERGLTQLGLVSALSALNRQYLTKYHQKDVSRWLNTGNRTTSGVIGFPKYETMSILADFFGSAAGSTPAIAPRAASSASPSTKRCPFSRISSAWTWGI